MNHAVRATMMFAALLVGACGGGGGGGGSSSTSASASASGTGTSVSASSSSSGSALYDRDPIISSCDPGVLKDSEKQSALATFNQMRALHGLPAVTYDYPSDVYTRQSALLGVANQQLNHFPPTSWLCWTNDGYTGSSQSNLYLRWGSSSTQVSTASGLEALLVDNGVSTLGHRRWMLHPFLGTTSFGRVDGVPTTSSNYYTAMTLKVIGGTDANPAGSAAATRGFVAYPYGDYPARWFAHGWYMSFSVLANTASTWNNGSSQISFSGATIQVTDGVGNSLPVSSQSADYSGYGLPNSLQWIVSGTQDNVTYTVQISNVTVSGTPRTYSYTFRVVP